MMVPCMKSSSEMQIKANVLLWKAERFIRGRFLSRDPAVGQSWFLSSQGEWVWGEELFLMGVSLSEIPKSVRPSFPLFLLHAWIWFSCSFSSCSKCRRLNIKAVTWLLTLEDQLNGLGSIFLALIFTFLSLCFKMWHILQQQQQYSQMNSTHFDWQCKMYPTVA